MIVWSRPAGSGLPFCAEFDLDRSASVRSLCNGRYPAEMREALEGEPSSTERCGRCWDLSGGALAALDLLPCPFCGSAPQRMSRASDHTDTGQFHVVVCYCGGHGAKAWQNGDTAEHAAQRWNTRHVTHDTDNLALLMLGVLGQPAVGPDGNMIIHPRDELVPFEEAEVEITFGEAVAAGCGEEGADT